MDRIQVDRQPVKAQEKLKYIALYKPRGVLSAVTSPDPRPTVYSLVPVSGTLYPVCRLDVDSEGLILLTNDGELANKLTYPRYEHEKEYRVLIARHPDPEQLATWRRGVVLEGGYRTAPANVRAGHEAMDSGLFSLGETIKNKLSRSQTCAGRYICEPGGVSRPI